MRNKRPLTLFWVFMLLAGSPVRATAQDEGQIARDGLEYGASIGKLLWVATKSATRPTSTSEAQRYLTLANRVKDQIEIGRASSQVVAAGFNLKATALASVAVVDPEPVTKVVAAVAAWGSKKIGDALSEEVMRESQAQATTILAKGLRQNGISPNKLKSMSADDIRSTVAGLKVGNQTMREALADTPRALDMISAHAVDLATDIGVEALARADAALLSVEEVRKSVGLMSERLEAFQANAEARLNTLTDRVGKLEGAIAAEAKSVEKLRTEVGANTRAIGVLSEISYSGWTTDQKLQAVRGGLFPDLSASQQQALEQNLVAQQAREQFVGSVNAAAKDFGNLAAIASNLGVDGSVVTGLQAAQTIATGIAQFATGDMLGALSSVTSLFGLGAPDADAQRHAALMNYLQQEFAVVNQKLDVIIDLQIKTFEAIATLAEQQQQFRTDVFQKLDRVEDAIHRNEKMLQAVLLQQWQECKALINGPGLNGQYELPNRDALVAVLSAPQFNTAAGGCHETFTNFFEAQVKSASWSGQVIAAATVASDDIQRNKELHDAWIEFQTTRRESYDAAAAFVANQLATGQDSKKAALHLARLAQPVSDAPGSIALDELFGRTKTTTLFAEFRCNSERLLAASLKTLLCLGTPQGQAVAPVSSRLSQLITAPLLGPIAYQTLDTGLALSTLVDFAVREDDGRFRVAPAVDISMFARHGASRQLQRALKQNKGLNLLERLSWLAEAMVLQQSVAYGDYTARLVVDVLYDKSRKVLSTDETQMTAAQKMAFHAMRANPLLAENVVLLALRLATEDLLGGTAPAAKANYRQSFYHLGLTDLMATPRCSAEPNAVAKLTELFPGWVFEYRVSSAEKKTPELKDCPVEERTTAGTDRGTGPAVKLGELYVVIPSALSLSSGLLATPDSLKLALAYRDKVAQQRIDRQMLSFVREVVAKDARPTQAAERAAFELLNEGMSWQRRGKSTEADKPAVVGASR